MRPFFSLFAMVQNMGWDPIVSVATRSICQQDDDLANKMPLPPSKINLNNFYNKALLVTVDWQMAQLLPIHGILITIVYPTKKRIAWFTWAQTPLSGDGRFSMNGLMLFYLKTGHYSTLPPLLRTTGFRVRNFIFWSLRHQTWAPARFCCQWNSHLKLLGMDTALRWHILGLLRVTQSTMQLGVKTFRRFPSTTAPPSPLTTPNGLSIAFTH